MADLSVNIAGVALKNPLIAASGAFGFGEEYSAFYPISVLGGVSSKGLTLAPRPGNPPPRIAETPSGMLNSVGLQNPGVEHFLEHDMPYLAKQDTVKIANIAGSSIEDYCAIAERLSESEIDMFELNISCPNVKQGGAAFGTSCESAERVVKEVRKYAKKPMIVKLSPNVTDITTIARAAVDAGADALSLINTLVGMRIDIRTGEPILSNRTGGVSGPAIFPIALSYVWRVRQALPDIPIIGIGGIDSGEKALEYLYAGANAVEVGAAALYDPTAPLRVARELDDLLDSRPELAAKLAAGETWR